MKVFNTVRLPGCAALLAVFVTGAFAGTASAAVSRLTLDPTAQLSPGRLHAYLTGTIACATGDSVSLSGQVVQANNSSGFGSAAPVCAGMEQAFTIDVSASGGFPGISGGVFKPGKASAQVTTSVCDPFPFPDPLPPFPPFPPFPTFPTCSTMYTDAIIRLQK
jgi:hypothetical protein